MNRVGRLLHVALQRKAGTLSLWVPGVVVVGLGRGDCCGAAEISSIRTTNATGIPNVVLDLPLG
jgi:hypothetical protein